MSAVTFARIPPRRSTTRAATWWGRAWVRAVEEAAYSEGDLHTARTLSRSGAIGGITVDHGTIVAACFDRSDVWSVGCTVPELDPISRRAFVDVVAAESGHLAALLSGELPYRLVEQSEEAGVELLPYGGELGSSCPCGAWVDPCVHALAVLLQVAWLVDGDPWVLLRLRGLSPEDLQAELGPRRDHRRGHPRRARGRPRGRGRRGGPRGPRARTRRRPERRDHSPGLRAGQRAQRHPVQHSAHRLVGDQAAVGRGVDQPEGRMGHGPGSVGVQAAVQPPQLGGPDVDVLALQGAHLLARLWGQGLPVPVLDDDQRAMAQREVDVPPDQRVDRVVRVTGVRHPRPPLVEEALADVHEHGGEDGVLRGEVLVERRAGDPARPTDLTDGDPVEALGGEQVGRGLENLVPPAHAHRLAVVNGVRR